MERHTFRRKKHIPQPHRGFLPPYQEIDIYPPRYIPAVGALSIREPESQFAEQDKTDLGAIEGNTVGRVFGTVPD